MWYNGYGDDALKPPLLNEDTSIYVVPFVIGKFSNNNRKVNVHCPVLAIELVWNADMCRCWAQYKGLEEHMTEETG